MTTPIISIATGTINRLKYLKLFVESIRKTIPDSIPYEIVVADNGSTDGTWDWMIEQDDIVPIQMGKPVGGIAAYTEAGRTCVGKYVIMAGDDIEFTEYGIVWAMRILEDDPLVGAVAFQNDRNKSEFGNDYIRARKPSGELTKALFLQVGMVRRWIGDEVGWFGKDGDMKDAWTYGGDNYISARIHELGYKIVEVPGIYHLDHRPDDDVRKLGHERHLNDAKIFHSLYPEGHLTDLPPQLPQQDETALRILTFPGILPNHPEHYRQKWSIDRAFSEFGIVYRVDYKRLFEKNPKEDVATHIVNIFETFRPHLVYSEIHNFSMFPLGLINELRSRNPETVWVNCIGDVWPKLLVSNEGSKLLEHVDVQLIVNLEIMDKIDEKLRHKLVYSPNTYEEVEPIPPLETADVVFLGNNYSPKRQEMWDKLHGIGVKFAGMQWPEFWQDTLYDFARTYGIYTECKIAISDNQFPESIGYSSNRLYLALYSGAFVLHQRSNGLEELTGLKPGKHYVEWESVDDLKEKIEFWLRPENDAKRNRIAKAGQRYVMKELSPEKKVHGIFRVINELADNDGLI